MTVGFGLLGEVEVRVDGRRLPLGHARQRAVLVALLVDANQLVAPDQLIDRVWGDRPPDTVRNTLHSYLSRLRRTLSGAPGVDIVRRSGGYLIAVDELTVDLHRFRRLVGQARSVSDGEQALALFERAFGLWRGEALAGLDTPWGDGVREWLNQQRLEAELVHTDLALRRGRHNELLSELSARVVARPLDERAAGQLMLALYRGGRQAEALSRYEQTRLVLAEEFGADPGPALRQLHQRILSTDPALDLVPEPDVDPTPPSAGDAGPLGRSVIPRQLPAPPGLFAGRVDELVSLDDAAQDQSSSGTTVVISAIGGSGGVGKTSLALRWAHTHLDRFPDGQLYADLRGFGPGPDPVPPSLVLRGFLAALGVNPSAVPVDADAQAGLYRSLVAGRRLLIVLDNARDTGQVLPLLPGSPTCTVLVTSRLQLTGLAATYRARLITLDMLSPGESWELLAGHLGRDRLAAEPAAVGVLLDHCAGLPLALGIVAARAATGRLWPLGMLAGELADTSTRLDALDAGELTVNLRAVFSWSLQALRADAAATFGLLGLAPTEDLSLAAVASLAAEPEPRVRELLRQLELTHLVQQHEPGRYRMHDLVRLYAGEQVDRTADAPARAAALRRLVEFYLHTACAADQLLDPRRAPVPVGEPPPGCVPLPLRSRAEAMTWFDREHSHLLTVQQLAGQLGLHSQVWQFAQAMTTFHVRGNRGHDQVMVWRVTLPAAREEGNRAIQAVAHRYLGQAAEALVDDRAATAHLRWAISQARRAGDVAEQARAHRALHVTWGRRGDGRRALLHALLGLRIFRRLGIDPVEEARGLNAVGWAHAQLGQYEQAWTSCTESAAVLRSHPHPDAEADTLHSLGFIAHRTGQHTEALAHFRQALELYDGVDNARGQVDCLVSLGELYASLGRRDEARQAWGRALTLLRMQHRGGEADALQEQIARQTLPG
ncbi:AfsR/SARP family transcriptional regulator [Plantactinospora soyae]|uniref:DNA-binding SARP family transcriptional activator/tetratricopeptide (TPR) repeat protein n=1 Tax=Plantactinospora soyae TaxID=1544732 RepID=A0A927R6C8_9ACTN|nr:BTAD domain-containing putative transcriptional regulator [Plantactinospora soyae]MBE1488309.1 DNA-binding SARP family transcriptional activator/tetratricopeptide (TPR) repeat protein [Plantactinospora soyae]